MFVELDPPAIEQLSEQDLIAKLNEFGVSMPGASVGALLTRYDECLREEDPAVCQVFVGSLDTSADCIGLGPYLVQTNVRDPPTVRESRPRQAVSV